MKAKDVLDTADLILNKTRLDVVNLVGGEPRTHLSIQSNTLNINCFLLRGSSL